MPLLTAPATSNGSFSFWVSGDEGPDYVIENAAEVSESPWVAVTTNLAPTPPFPWTTVATKGSGNLYRVRLAP